MPDDKRIAALAGRTTREIRAAALELAAVAGLLRERATIADECGLPDATLLRAVADRLASRVLQLEALANEHMALCLALVQFEDTPPPARGTAVTR